MPHAVGRAMPEGPAFPTTRRQRRPAPRAGHDTHRTLKCVLHDPSPAGGIRHSSINVATVGGLVARDLDRAYPDPAIFITRSSATPIRAVGCTLCRGSDDRSEPPSAERHNWGAPATV